MKPKIFVSSTYYDLKYIRENIEKLVRDLGFDSILFESGDVTFEHDKPIDSSCYKEVTNANMLLLIVGGRYGSEAITNGFEDYSKKYDKYYTSITKNEFLTAKDKGIPIYVFVDNNVLTEYETFKKNKDVYYQLEKEASTKKLNFAFVDSANIFEFIYDLYLTGLPIYRFNKYEDIEIQFRMQISGLLYLYLEGLIEKKNDEKVAQSVDSMMNLMERMEKMVQSVGKKVLEDDPEILNKIMNEQNQSIVLFGLKQMGKKITTSMGNEKDFVIWNNLSSYILDDYLFSDRFHELIENQYNENGYEHLREFRAEVKDTIINLLSSQNIILEKIDFNELEDLATDINLQLKDCNLYEIKAAFAKILYDNWMPF